MQVPSGGIILWYGSIVNIPTKFVLCDGNNGTPDLRDLFVVGAGGAYAVGATGGNTTHTHDFTSDGHTHTLVSGTNISVGPNVTPVTDVKTDSGTTDPTNHLPPYYALAYIMKT